MYIHETFYTHTHTYTESESGREGEEGGGGEGEKERTGKREKIVLGCVTAPLVLQLEQGVECRV